MVGPALSFNIEFLSWSGLPKSSLRLSLFQPVLYKIKFVLKQTATHQTRGHILVQHRNTMHGKLEEKGGQ